MNVARGIAIVMVCAVAQVGTVSSDVGSVREAPMCWAPMTAEAVVDDMGLAFSLAWSWYHVDGLLGSFSSDAHFVTPFGGEARGKAEIRKLLSAMQNGIMKEKRFQITRSQVRHLSPEAAVAEWDVQLVGFKPCDPAVVEARPNHLTFLLTRHAGFWEVDEAHWLVYLASKAELDEARRKASTLVHHAQER